MSSKGTLGAASAEAMESLSRLDDIDGLVDVSRGDELIRRYLTSDVDLRLMLSTQESELKELQEAYIQQHCDDAELLCALYQELTECELKLEAFEEEMSTFQANLTDTAEDMGKMQRQTVELVHQVMNRKQVSDRINQVYNALKECETFCEDLSAKDVDEEYLLSIRELEKQIAFLANNPELRDSAVDREISPKLEEAAHRVGDKMNRYLSKKMRGFTEEGTNVTLRQQALIAVGQYAYTFLARYNKAVAAQLQQVYIDTLSEVYSKQVRHTTRDLATFLRYAAGNSGGIVAPQLVAAVRSGADWDGASFAPPAPIAPAAAEIQSRRSVSTASVSFEDRMRGFAEKVRRGKSEAPSSQPKRGTDVSDVVRALQAVDFSLGTISLDPVESLRLDESSCWVWRFVRALSGLVNTTVAESRFLSNFFFHGQDIPERDLFELEEVLANHVLGKSIALFLECMKDILPHVTDRLSCLAALRAADQQKTYLCQDSNPIPILLMSFVFEVVTGTLRKTLHEQVGKEVAALANAALGPFTPYPSTALDGKPLVERIQGNSKFAAAVGVHDVARHFAATVAPLHLVNTAVLPCSKVAESFDEHLSTVLRAALTSFITLIEGLAGRHTDAEVQQVFRVCNFAFVLLSWHQFAQTFLWKAAERSSPSLDSPKSAGADAALLEVFSAGPQVAPESHIRDLIARLHAAVLQFVALHARRISVHELLAVLQEAENTLGAAFFAKPSSASSNTGSSGSSSAPAAGAAAVTVDPNAATTALPELLREASLLEVLSNFSKNWSADLRKIHAELRIIFGLRGGSDRARSVTPDTAALEDTVNQELSRRVVLYILREYFQTIAEANAKAHHLVNMLYGKNMHLRAKLVGTSVFLQDAQNLLQAAESS